MLKHLLLALLFVANTALADTQLVVGFPVGGAADAVARTIAAKVSDITGEKMIVVNKPGADSTIAANAVAKASPDGKTFLLGTNTSIIAAKYYMDLPYDAEKELLPIAYIGQFEYTLIASPTLGVKTPAELKEWIRAHPGKVNFASSNSAAYLASLQFLDGLIATYIPVKGDDVAMPSIINGEIHFMFSASPSAYTLSESGKVVNMGMPIRLNAVPWAGIFAPINTSWQDRVKYSAAFVTAMRSKDVKDTLAKYHYEAAGQNYEFMEGFLIPARKQWEKLVKDGVITR